MNGNGVHVRAPCVLEKDESNNDTSQSKVGKKHQRQVLYRMVIEAQVSFKEPIPRPKDRGSKGFTM
jgi:hypothetical protein